MGKVFKSLMGAALALSLLSCGESKFSEGQDFETTPVTIDPVESYSPDETGDTATYATQHCADIASQTHQFYSYMKSVNNRTEYAKLLESQGVCKTFNGWTQTTSGSSQWWQYEQNLGTSSCDYWNQTPMGITLAFFQGYPQTVTIAIDATGDGWAMNGGQGFPVRQVQIGGQIDCTQENLAINAYTANGWLQIVAPKEYGNKYSTDMRATIYFNGENLGTTFLSRQ